MNKKTTFEFIDTPRRMPRQVPIALRKSGDWNELYGQFTGEDAKQQSARCLDCGNPYCSWGCPLHNAIPDWLELAREGRIHEAADLCHETNPLPEVCGRVCPQDRLCEGACTLNDGFGAVTIGAVEKYIVDAALADGWRPDLSRVTATGKRVAVVGAGPAGLACADRLARVGIAATVFDRYEKIGGLLQFGIPSFKLDRSVMATRHEILVGMGIEFRLGVEVGRDVGLAALLADYDAVFLGLGSYRYTDGGLPGQDLANVLPALPFLVQNGRIVVGDDAAGRPIAGWEDHVQLPDLHGRRVVVLGGGDTGMDCVRSAVRLGAASVRCVYRRDEASMPGSAREVANARDEGVEFLFNRQPLALLGDDDGVHTVRMVSTTAVSTAAVSKAAAASGAADRGIAAAVPGSETELPADVVIIAFGFQPDAPAWLSEHGIALEANGRIRVAKPKCRSNRCNTGDAALPFQTTHPRVFAGGDGVRGADLVVTAAFEGREAGKAIASLLGQA